MKFSVWMELTKPRITLINVLMAAGGMALAGGTQLPRALWILLGTALAVAAANTLNMILERSVDANMERTAARPLPSGRLGLGEALGLALLLTVGSVFALLQVGLLPTALGVGAILLYAFVYTPLKRRAALALIVGAVAGAVPPLIGWTGAGRSLDLAALALFLALVAWQIPHFLAIGLIRLEDYRRAGLRITPVVYGPTRTRIEALVGSTLLLVASLALVPLGVAGWMYAVLAAILGLAFWFHTLQGFWSLGQRSPVWARQLFLHSILYLPLWTLALLLDRLLLAA